MCDQQLAFSARCWSPCPFKFHFLASKNHSVARLQNIPFKLSWRIPWHVFKTFPSSFLGAFRGTSSKIIPWHVLAHSVARLQNFPRKLPARIPWHVFKNREKNLPGLGLNPGAPPSEADPLTTRPSQRLFWNKKSHTGRSLNKKHF